jgi:PAS domain S-box-containing protein
VVRPLLAGQTHLRKVVAAPGMVIRMAVPLQGNEAAIGVDYRRTPSQAEAAQRARDSGQLVLAGPLKLVQGGTGLIARLPVFVGGAQGQHFWGLVSAVIDQDRLFRSAGVQSPAQPIEVAIRGTDARGADGAVFLGRAAVFEHKPVLFELPLPQGSWQLAAVPRGGWTTHSPSQWQLRAGYGFAALLLLGVFVALARSLAAASVARERAETAQRQVLAILEGAPDATLLLDGDGRIERANTQAERLFGRRREQIEGQPLAELVPAAERGRLSTLEPAGLCRHGPCRARDNHLEMTGVRADGSLFPLEMSLSLLQLGGRPGCRCHSRRQPAQGGRGRTGAPPRSPESEVGSARRNWLPPRRPPNRPAWRRRSSGQHVARDPHAAERDHRHGLPDPRHLTVSATSRRGGWTRWNRRRATCG